MSKKEKISSYRLTVTNTKLMAGVYYIFTATWPVDVLDGSDVRLDRDLCHENLDLDIMIIHSDLVGLDAMAPLWDGDLLLPAVKMGMITEEEFAQAKADVAQHYTSPDAIDIYTLLFGCGQKPGGD